MADSYYAQRSAPTQYQRDYSQQHVVYPPQLLSTTSSNRSSPEDGSPHSPPKSDQPPPMNKSDSNATKPQATFLTKLYSLLERPENQHMIRWDPAGEHIIVERPEQLALHVLPSIYRQSRFASFSRQLNIYGFMRKVNLRNVDPAIDDPDASTWSHPTLNRHSPPEVVANFKRRVPPRLPKPRKRVDEQQIPNAAPRSATGLGSGVPLSIPSVDMNQSYKAGGRNRGFSAPGSYPPVPQSGNSWAPNNYSRQALPPLTVPSDPPMSHGMYSNSPHSLHPIPSEENGGPGYNGISSYSTSSRDLMVNPSQYPYAEQNSWSFSPVSSGSSSATSGSLSSLLNPSSSNYPPTRPTINTNYASSFSSMPQSASSLSPDSRPATGYSVSSMGSISYDDTTPHHYDSRPGSSYARPLTPTSSRPSSSKANYSTTTGSLSIRRQRRHSQVVGPYPTPYDHIDDRGSSSPSDHIDEEHSMHRSRSMIQLPSVDPYANFNSSQPDFAYTVPSGGGSGGMGSMEDGAWNTRSVRPSTSASSVSAASQSSSSQARTPPVIDGYAEADVHRFSPDLGYVSMSDPLAHYAAKAGGDP